jgi:hypothetical protein
MSADGATNQAAQWEVLKGVPPEGPAPKHFHRGRPTPSEYDFVVRFRKADGSEWIGTFQPDIFGPDEVRAWPEANAVIVYTAGNFYLFDPSDPSRYESGGPLCRPDFFLNDDHTKLIVYDFGTVVAYGRDRTAIWQFEVDVGTIDWVRDVDGVITLGVRQELKEPVVIRLSPEDGRRIG